MVCGFEFGQHCVKHEHFAGTIDKVLVYERLVSARNQRHLDQVRVVHHFAKVSDDFAGV